MKKAILIVGAGCSFAKEVLMEAASVWDTFILTEHKERFDDLAEISASLKAGFPMADVYCHRVDVSFVADINRLMSEIDQNGLTITAAVYCPGINIIEPALSVSERVWDQIMNVNLKGFFFMARAVAAHMILSEVKGSILAIASQHAVVANYNRAPYCASKAGLVHLIREMALEFAHEGIRFNAISPTFIENERNKSSLHSIGLREEYLDNIPLGRYGTASDIAGAVGFLLSSKAAFVTGQNIIVDGGYTIK